LRGSLEIPNFMTNFAGVCVKAGERFALWWYEKVSAPYPSITYVTSQNVQMLPARRQRGKS
jgi:hypothetical protein